MIHNQDTLEDTTQKKLHKYTVHSSIIDDFCHLGVKGVKKLLFFYSTISKADSKISKLSNESGCGGQRYLAGN